MDAVFLSLYCSRCPGLTLQPFCSLFWYDQKALDLGVVLDIHVSVVVQHPVACSVGFDQLCASIVDLICCRMRILRSEIRYSLVQG